MDPEVVAVPRILAVEGGALHGRDGIRGWRSSVFGVFPGFDVEVMDIRRFSDVTISNVRARGHGQGSTTPFEDAVGDVSPAQQEGRQMADVCERAPKPWRPPGCRSSALDEKRLFRFAWKAQ